MTYEDALSLNAARMEKGARIIADAISAGQMPSDVKELREAIAAGAKLYEVIDTRTHSRAGRYHYSQESARRSMDKKNSEYGARRFIVREVKL